MDLFGDLPPPSEAPALLKQHDNNGGSAVPGKRTCSERTPVPGGEAQQKKPRVFVSLQLKGFVAERRGEREDMQDAHTILDDFSTKCSSLSNEISLLSYYGVFDGHAGHRASQYAAQHLHKIIADKMPTGSIENIEKEIKRCLVESFKKTDEDFLVEAAKATPSLKDGCTAAVLLVVNDVIFSANLGDSRAVLCRRKQQSTEYKCVQLTKDHTAAIFEERKRIEKAGGMVRDGRVMGVVEVSRSIGDGRFKRCGVIATPDVFRCQISNEDRFIIVACDGLWKVFTAQEAAKYIDTILEDDTIQIPKDEATTATNFQSTLPTSVREYRYSVACTQLAVEAVRRGCTDNVTVMLIDILYPQKEQTQSPDVAEPIDNSETNIH